jgi:hypothetical protein
MSRSNAERPIRYFALQNLSYHGHDIGIVSDADGGRYTAGRGLSVFVDGKRRYGPGALQRVSIPLSAKPPMVNETVRQIDFAVNLGVADGPTASASSVAPGSSVAEAIDGRLWFFPSNPNGWSPVPDAQRDGSVRASRAPTHSWYGIDFRRVRTIDSAKLYFFADGSRYLPPSAFRLQYRAVNGWRDIPAQRHLPRVPIANGENTVTFPPLAAQNLRVVFARPAAHANFRLVELKAFAPLRLNARTANHRWSNPIN